MKTILTILMPLVAIVSGIFSFTMFSEQYHYMSAILTIISYLSASAWVYLLIDRPKVAHQ